MVRSRERRGGGSGDTDPGQPGSDRDRAAGDDVLRAFRAVAQSPSVRGWRRSGDQLHCRHLLVLVRIAADVGVWISGAALLSGQPGTESHALFTVAGRVANA